MEEKGDKNTFAGLVSGRNKQYEHFGQASFVCVNMGVCAA